MLRALLAIHSLRKRRKLGAIKHALGYSRKHSAKAVLRGSEGSADPDGGTQKFKGSFNEGQKTLQLALDEDDAGQILLKAALNSDDDYSFQVEYQGGGIDYFQAKVVSWQKARAE